MFRWWVAIVAAGNLLPSAPWRIYFFPSSFAPEMGKGKLFPRPLNCIRSHWWLFSSQTPPSASRDLFQSVEKEKKKPSLTWRGRKEMALCSLLSEEHLRKEEKKRHNRWKCIERGPCGWGAERWERSTVPFGRQGPTEWRSFLALQPHTRPCCCCWPRVQQSLCLFGCWFLLLLSPEIREKTFFHFFSLTISGFSPFPHSKLWDFYQKFNRWQMRNKTSAE